MITERYTVALFGIDSKYYTDEYIAYLWEESANLEYSQSNIYVSALITEGRIVCGSIRGCDLPSRAYILIIVRNPAETESEIDFYISLINILSNIREKLDYPSMTISVDSINYNFFQDRL